MCQTPYLVIPAKAGTQAGNSTHHLNNEATPATGD